MTPIIINRSYALYIGLLMFFTGCSGLPVTPERDTSAKKSIRHLFLGDSYTIGQGVAADKRWPSQLTDSLKARGVSVEASRVIAKTGWTVAGLLNGIREGNPDSSWTHVSILIGVNNQYQRRPVKEFLMGLDTLLLQARRFTPTGTIYLLTIPDYSYTPFAGRDSLRIRSEIEQYNREIRQAAVDRQLILIDVTTVSKSAGKDPSLLADDRLHPSGKQYQVWVDSVLKRVRF